MITRALRNVARKVYLTPNTVRYDVEIPRILEGLSHVGKVDTLLDAGAGGGYYCTAVYAKAAARLIAVEFDPGNFAILQSTLAPIKNRCTILNASLTDIPVDDGKVDCVVCSQVMEHIEDDGKVVDEFRRVLKAGGHAVVSVPYPPAPWPEPEHVREGYHLEDMVRLFEGRGFKLIHDDYFFTRATQELIHRVRSRPRMRMLRGLSPRPAELSMTREERVRDAPYVMLCVFQKS